jgi:fatty acyl-CoA reductase
MNHSGNDIFIFENFYRKRGLCILIFSKAIAMNVKSTQSVLNLAKETVNLKQLVYVGTAFSSCCLQRFEEIVSRPLFDPLELMALMKVQDEETFNRETYERVRGGHPNTYTLTKQMSESLVNDFAIANNIRTLIAKPGIITPPIREPCAHYVESVSQGAQAVSASLGIGLLTVVPGQVTNAFAGIPVDTCANSLLVSCADADHKWQSDQSDKVKVYGLYNTTDNIITNRQPFHVMARSAHKYPTLKAVRPPVPCSFTTSPLLYVIQVWLFEFVFGFFFDLTLMLAGKPARMLKVIKKANRTMAIVGYFVCIDWKVCGHNVADAFANLSKEEKLVFDCNLSDVDWDEYFEKFWLGLRKWIFHEELDNLQEARTRLKR